ncbi:hypothetical protein [Streptomyces odonnellii]|uniref:hypothetical protein n=1 Tax=Streptomyces odonnellii TaxID=1417980 RepID=UPI000696CF30|nr:hypothetical protein [Streptomyces odonnellii]
MADPHQDRAGEGHHVAGAACLERGAELRALAVGFVAEYGPPLGPLPEFFRSMPDSNPTR